MFVIVGEAKHARIALRCALVNPFHDLLHDRILVQNGLAMDMVCCLVCEIIFVIIQEFDSIFNLGDGAALYDLFDCHVRR